MKWFRVGPSRIVLAHEKAWTILKFESQREWFLRAIQRWEDQKPKKSFDQSGFPL